MNPRLSAIVQKWKAVELAKFAIAILAACILLPDSLHAGAWTQEAGHGQIILTSSLFRTGATFDGTGNPMPFGDAGRFRQFTINPYLEYGLTSRNTLVANFSVPWLNFSNSFGKQSSVGLGDVEVALKRRLNSIESPWALSGQFTVSFPAYSAQRSPAPGNHQMDLEGRVMAGRGLSVANRHAFYDLGLAYRYRNGAPADQVRSEASAGFDVTHRLMVMGQFFAIKGLRNGEPSTLTSNPNAQSDFDLYKYQPSLVFTISRRTHVQLGWSSAFSGRNTGRGSTAILSFWKTF